MAYDSPQAFFDNLGKRVESEEARAQLQDIGATYLFKLEGDEEGAWTLDCSEPSLTEGESDDADCTVKMDSNDFLQMVNGEVQGQQLFMLGKLQIEGDMTLALRLEQVFSAGE